MSYILDALRKADQERNLGEVPDLEAAHWGVRRHSRSQYWKWAVGSLLVFNVLLVAYLVIDRDPESVAQYQARQAPVEKTTPVPVPVVPVPEAQTGTQLTETRRPRVPVRTPVARAPATQPEPVPAAVSAPPPASLPGAPATPAAPAAAGEFSLPEWSELSLEFRSRFRLPSIDVHVYAEDPGRRFIMADLKKYREGETLENGALLEKIHPGSIQLNYEGTRFRVDR
jgi:general secretion pathway protein B